MACGGGGGSSPRFCLQLALGGLAAPHRFRDQFVGQNQPGVGDVFHHQQHVGIFFGADVIAMKPHGIALDAGEDPAKTLAALMGDRHLDLHEMADVAFEIRAAHQRAIDARR